MKRMKCKQVSERVQDVIIRKNKDFRRKLMTLSIKQAVISDAVLRRCRFYCYESETQFYLIYRDYTRSDCWFRWSEKEELQVKQLMVNSE